MDGETKTAGGERMSVLIKGAEIPQKCEDCDCYITTSYYWPWCCLNKTYQFLQEDAESGRPDWCPLTEVDDDVFQV